MIPSHNEILLTSLVENIQPSLNYKMNIEKEFINGKCDQIEAMKQVVYKILSTERYEYIIYSWDYGIELKDLFGQPVFWVCPELERRIEEALLQDDRIKSVGGFDFDTAEKRTVKVKFTVNTIFGEIDEEMVVNY